MAATWQTISKQPSSLQSPGSPLGCLLVPHRVLCSSFPAPNPGPCWICLKSPFHLMVGSPGLAPRTSLELSFPRGPWAAASWRWLLSAQQVSRGEGGGGGPRLPLQRSTLLGLVTGAFPGKLWVISVTGPLGGGLREPSRPLSLKSPAACHVPPGWARVGHGLRAP